MPAIYVLTDRINESLNRYKVGSHKGTLEELRLEYITSLPNLIVRYFIQIKNAKEIKNHFMFVHENVRIINSMGNRSEWVKMSLDEIFNAISPLICRSRITFEENTQTINLTDTQNGITDVTSRLQTCYVTCPQITIQSVDTFVVSTAPAPANSNSNSNYQNDELRIQELKNMGIKYKRRKGECQTPDEFELFQLINKIKRRRSRANKKTGFQI